MAKIGIIGGSGLYQIEGLSAKRQLSVNTPFGKPSDDLVVGKLAGKEVVFLPRHGRGHRLNPSEINYRANIFAMKKLGVERIISVTACGSLRQQIKPLEFVLPDQFVDRTNQARKVTFFENGIVAHISFAHPICGNLHSFLVQILEQLKIPFHKKGTYLCMEGPAFSTQAESNLYRSWGMDIIGMTNISEAKLAREAEICYATLAAVTDYDCWYEPAEPVTVEMVLTNLQKNVANAKKIIKEVIARLPLERDCSCSKALKDAIVTHPEFIPISVKKKLNPLIGKYLKR
ncbi:MAG: S-methyl-5'-thioadenosine phosphorylase [Candidatus Omnitrophica bacterium]|nr:S-methyl-5'-thioadenosine phosphorylase [Candidatus Omnitrophota bacterium]